jgi:hypothetical protein
MQNAAHPVRRGAERIPRLQNWITSADEPILGRRAGFVKGGSENCEAYSAFPEEGTQQFASDMPNRAQRELPLVLCMRENDESFGASPYLRTYVSIQT